MEDLFFGTEGTPVSSKKRSSIAGIRRIHELGLGCMEIQFLHDIRMGKKTAYAVHEAAENLDIRLSAHAPYYINLNADDEKLSRYRELVLQSARIGYICGAKNMVTHAGSYQGDPQQAVYEKIKNILNWIQEQLKNENMDITLRIETTGKNSQFGSLEEVLALTEVEGVLPCVDFPHLNARTGQCNSSEDFARVLAQVEDRLGRKGLENMYVHASGVEPSEKRYAVAEPDFNYKELAQVFSDFGIKGLVVSGSPDMEEDALRLKREYERIKMKH